MKQIDVPCFVDIEQTPESLHAHAIPEGVDIRPGDSVLVHGAPSRIGYGERVLDRMFGNSDAGHRVRPVLDYLRAFFELVELFEVGFQPKEST